MKPVQCSISARFRPGWTARCVLAGLRLDIRPGELLMVVGPGGSGKSTVLIELEKLVKCPISGPGSWVGQRPGEFRVAARMPQHCRRELALVGALFWQAGINPKIDRKYIPDDPRLRAELLGVLDRPLASVADHLRRAISFMLTSCETADLLLLDEPSANLPSAWSGHVQAVLTMLRGRRTVVAVTHHLPLARAAADRVALLVDGELIEVAATRDFFERPRHQRTRQFVEWGA